MQGPSPVSRRRQRPRGQSVVEFALVLPVLLFLMLVALDFGRIYLGYVNLQNLTRIAANFAANDPDAWQATPNLATQARYRDIVLNDAKASNCDLPGNPDTVAAPTFTDTNGDGDTRDLGDLAKVGLTCTFSIWTPGISAIFNAGTIAVSAESIFPIKSGLSVTSGPPGGGGSAPGAAFSADVTSGAPALTVKFMDESGGSPTAWVWDFGDGGASTERDPTHIYQFAGTYSVKLTASNGAGSNSVTKTAYITVATPGVVDFVGIPTSGTKPLVVQFTDNSTGSPTAWLWEFGDGATATTRNPSHTYANIGAYDVKLTVTTPTGPGTLTKNAYINVQVGLCKVPDFVTPPSKRNKAQQTWSAAGFTTTVTDRPGSSGQGYTITFQSLTGNSMVPCNSTIQVGG
jgi:PKD repeat protein